MFLFFYPLVLLAQDTENYAEEAEDNFFSVYDYLAHPLYVKKAKLADFYRFPFLSTERASDIYEWLQDHRYITPTVFRNFLNDEDLYQALRPFLIFSGQPFLKYSSSSSFNGNGDMIFKNKFSCSRGNHAASIWQRYYSAERTRNGFSYTFTADAVILRAGNYTLSTPLRLLQDGAGFDSPLPHHADAIYYTAPFIGSSSGEGQPLGMVIKLSDADNNLFLFAGNLTTAVKKENEIYTDFYSDPFYLTANRPELNWLSGGIIWWRRFSSSAALTLQISANFARHAPDSSHLSPLLYHSSIKDAENLLLGGGFYSLTDFLSTEYELLITKKQNCSWILRNSFFPRRDFQWNIAAFYYSPRIFPLNSRAVLSFNSVPYNLSGIVIDGKKKYRHPGFSSVIKIEYSRTSEIEPLDYFSDKTIKNRFMISVKSKFHSLMLRNRLKSYLYKTDGQKEKQYITDFSAGWYRNRSDRITLAPRIAISASGPVSVSTSWETEIRHKSSFGILWVFSWMYFSLKKSYFGFYENELSYYPGTEWLRLSGNGFKLTLLCKLTRKRYSAGIKIRELRRYDDADNLIKNSYIWLFADLYTCK